VRFKKKPGNFVLLIERERHVQHAALAMRRENRPFRTWTWFRLVEFLNLAGLSAESFEKFSRFFEWHCLAHLFVKKNFDTEIIRRVDQLDQAVRNLGNGWLDLRVRKFEIQ